MATEPFPLAPHGRHPMAAAVCSLISVVFQVTANGVGLLDPGAERNSVEKGAKVDLPFWLAHGMLSLEQAVSINVPPCFTQKTRKEIQADAACVDLRVRCPYFYELGCKIVPLVGDKSIGQFLRYAFASRYKEILSKAHSSSTMTVPKFTTRLTKEEAQGTNISLVHLLVPLFVFPYHTNLGSFRREVFESARESMSAFRKWRVGGARLQKASILGRKRKTKLPDGPSTP
ncbi:hypothetical protein TRIUR3_26614 [Triticum urartu]|uniref:Uncharacterized protein n=1 Tax=Triticum urartu TaxID=4572 RepID=M8AFI1_TRIUA|nr:hypothetical protein TRIUR3_26614 [Triticum urartu]